MANIKILVGDEEFDAVLQEDSAPETVAKIIHALPIEAIANTWGEEIYFEISVRTNAENAVETVRVGDLGFWPAGSAFCIFYGKTPMSSSEEEIKPASEVNPIGRIENPEALKKHAAGERVVISLAE